MGQAFCSGGWISVFDQDSFESFLVWEKLHQSFCVLLFEKGPLCSIGVGVHWVVQGWVSAAATAAFVGKLVEQEGCDSAAGDDHGKEEEEKKTTLLFFLLL